MEVSYCADKGIPHAELLGWDVSSRAKLLAQLMEAADRCQMCGTAEWEWNENAYAYEPNEHFCKGCYLREIANEGRTSLPGTRIELTPVSEALRLQQYLTRKRRESLDMEDEHG